MPLNFSADASAYADEAFFPDTPLLDDVIAAIPSLLGAFDAADYTGVGAWMPRIGSGASILPAASGTPPVKATRDGASVLRFEKTGKAFVNDLSGAALALSGLVYASRAYFSDETTNFQKVFDLGAPEFYFRSTMTTPVWQFAGLGTAGTVPIAAPVLGWHRFTFSKTGTDAAQLTADGSALAGVGSAGSALAGNALVLGDAGNATSAVQDIRRIVICSDGVLTAEQRGAIDTWVGL